MQFDIRGIMHLVSGDRNLELIGPTLMPPKGAQDRTVEAICRSPRLDVLASPCPLRGNEVWRAQPKSDVLNALKEA
jgi:hypothetical protein